MLYTFVSNKPFGSLLGISPTNHIFLITDQTSKPLEVEDNSDNLMVWIL